MASVSLLEVFSVISFPGNVAWSVDTLEPGLLEGCRLAVPDVGNTKDGREAEGRRQQRL
jgi:hypothetical protein